LTVNCVPARATLVCEQSSEPWVVAMTFADPGAKPPTSFVPSSLRT